MPQYLYTTMQIFFALIWISLIIISILIIVFSFIKGSVTKAIKPLIFLIFGILLAFIHLTFISSAFGVCVTRRLAIETLRELSLRQRIFFEQHQYYGRTFQEIGCDVKDIRRCIKISHYTFYMNNDNIFWLGIDKQYELPSYIIKRPNVIYAIGKPYLARERYDIFSIDYDGNLEVIESQVWWLPY